MFIYVLSFIIVLLDQITKFLALKYLAPYKSIAVIPNIFHLSLVQNPGIAFGLFGTQAPVLTAVVMLCLAGLFILSFQMRKANLVQRVSLAFIMGGAVGNLIDRLVFGHVVDFLDFRVWPVFNIADSFITVGVLTFLLISMRKS